MLWIKKMPIIVTIEGAIAQVSIDRPEKRNTFNIAMCEEFSNKIRELEKDPRVKVIIITGQNNIFSAGLDLDESKNQLVSIEESFQKAIDSIDSCAKPIIAAVSGPAVGQGVALLYHCDLVFCGEHSLFSLPSLALGLPPMYGVSLLSVKSAGFKLATQKILLSEPISATEAVAMGIVNHVVDDDKVMTVASGCALRLCTLPPKALEATRRLLRAAYLNGLLEQRKLEEEAFKSLVGEGEIQEAFNAFLEKRRPNFSD